MPSWPAPQWELPHAVSVQLTNKKFCMHLIFVKFHYCFLTWLSSSVGLGAWACPGKRQVFLLLLDISGIQNECIPLYCQASHRGVREGWLCNSCLLFSVPAVIGVFSLQIYGFSLQTCCSLVSRFLVLTQLFFLLQFQRMGCWQWLYIMRLLPLSHLFFYSA